MKAIEIALSQVGYLEKASNKDLDDFTANAGDKNFTKYARDLDNIPGFYKGKKQGAPWCDVLVDWCFVEAYGAENAKRILCQPDSSYGAGCSWSAKYYKDNKRFFNSPEVGDQIFFKRNGKVVHTGIVYNIQGKTVYTIEGNTSGESGVVPNGGAVCKKSYSNAYGGIYGYGRPRYEEAKKVIVMLDELKEGSKGAQVKSLQQLLTAKGYALLADGEFGKKTAEAVRKYQSDRKLFVDGIVGAKTWGDILGA